MMQFFGTLVTKDDPMDLQLDEGDVFHLTHAMIDPRSTGTGKVYLQAVISLMEEGEEIEDEEFENEIRVPICMLESGKTEQVSLDLHFNFEQIVKFELVGSEKSPNTVAITGTMITMEAGGCEDEDCDDEHCGIDHEDDEELDSDADEFNDSIDDEEEEEEEDIPTLIPAKPTKVTNKKAVATPDKAAANKPANKQQPAKQQPVKQEPQTPVKQQPAKQQPAKQQPAKQQPAKQQPVKQEPQSPAKPQQANNKRPQPQTENNKKKQKK
ncbi:hypothetical protein DICPUDRAFT_75879 [Dictyostelium purpureum]|uniref:Nucleoplasmin-like domain-containing protein n=1 Tax=Dictyostelium purpureum TaxID=5786 RepID=F0ZBX9_DICPU|nr:uncharacterized protein DICPUDRAFT_75879 [Dictyostelium purpureum]EGC38538.1 hypothetical protein DICPUDRAFT_75879 [Dictyostelium purpureum]|eukprot:XP_003284909.1 hypothetical protein DICPUDRAFT_75879 [Dictyostelium purpureum]